MSKRRDARATSFIHAICFSTSQMQVLARQLNANTQQNTSTTRQSPVATLRFNFIHIHCDRETDTVTDRQF